MSRASPVVWFLARAIALYVVLLLAWPLVGNAYAAGYRAAANIVFGPFRSDCVVRYQAAPDAVAHADTLIKIRNVRARTQGGRVTSARYRGYFPMITLVALVLATPVPWPRRWRALLWGFPVLCLLIALRELLVLMDVLSGNNPIAIYDPGPFWRGFLDRAAKPLAVSTVSPFVMPVLVWIAITFRADDWKAWFGGHNTDS